METIHAMVTSLHELFISGCVASRRHRCLPLPPFHPVKSESATPSQEKLSFESASYPRLTHHLFRYPAKFHPPVVGALLDLYAVKDAKVLDPFCGSGTVLVEANSRGLNATGIDVDPIAVFISTVKTRLIDVEDLGLSCRKLVDVIGLVERSAGEYERLQFNDLEQGEVEVTMGVEELHAPAIPKIWHWFRRYVVVDLARILQRIQTVDVPDSHRDFFRLAFAASIRNASNADPVPVSGLEFTSHMKAKDAAGRVVNPFALFRRALKRALDGITSSSSVNSWGKSTIIQADATDLSSSAVVEQAPFDLVVTSPPYHNAVDYYRRHQLEMFWLGLVDTQEDRIQLKQKYVGRDRVTNGDVYRDENYPMGPEALNWERQMTEVGDVQRARALRHYIVSMGRSFQEIASVTGQGALAICVVGHSRWREKELPTNVLLAEAARGHFNLEKVLWYPLKNRYMSYSRHNGASIDKEFVLVLRKT